jgi:hypothetical protein
MTDPREHGALPAADRAERWVIILRDAGGSDQPAGRRVAGLLKAALRQWHLRCESVSTTTPSEQLTAARAEVLTLQREVARLRRQLGKRKCKATV